MRYATMDDFEDVWNVFKKNREWLGHVRKSKVKSRIEREQLIFEEGVVITFHISLNNTNFSKDTNVRVNRGDVILHQIGVSEHRKGLGAKILSKFLKEIQRTVYLGVADSNIPANALYAKCGMEKAGWCRWSEGKLPGTVWVSHLKSNNIDSFFGE